MDWDHAVVAAADSDSMELIGPASAETPTANSHFANRVGEQHVLHPAERFMSGDGTGDKLSNPQSTLPRSDSKKDAFFQTQDLLTSKDSLLNNSQLPEPYTVPFAPFNLQQRRQLTALPPFSMSGQRSFSPSSNSTGIGSTSLTTPPFAESTTSQSPQYAGFTYPYWQATSNYSYAPSTFSTTSAPQATPSIFRSPSEQNAGNGLPGPADLQQLGAENGPLPPLNTFPLASFPSSFPLSSSNSPLPSAGAADANQGRVSPTLMPPIPSTYYPAETVPETGAFTTLPHLSPYLERPEHRSNKVKVSKRRRADTSEAGSSGGNASSGDSARPYRCDKCALSFNRNHDLKRHRRIHLEIKPFPCLSCQKAFSRKDALKRHAQVKGCKIPITVHKYVATQPTPVQTDISMPQPMSHHPMSIPSLPSGILSIP